MSLAPNTTIAQFTTAYSATLSSLGIESSAQALMSDGSIVYGRMAAEPFDMPLIKVDSYGSRSTAARDQYILLSLPKERVFPIPTLSDDFRFLTPSSRFLSDIELLEDIIDRKRLTFVEHEEDEEGSGQVERKKKQGRILWQLGLREALKIIGGNGRIERRSSAPISYHEVVEAAVNHTRDFDLYASSRVLAEDPPLKTARRYFIAGILYSAYVASTERAAEMFAQSAKHFCESQKHPVAAAAVAEIPAWLWRQNTALRDEHLSQAADAWNMAADKLNCIGDITGAIIATYRGLRAAALSKNHEAMRRLFAISSEINGKRGNTGEQTRDHLRTAQTTFNTYIHGTNSDHHLVWKEAYWGLQFAFELMRDQEMIDAIKPFLVAAKERAGLG